MLDVAWSVFEIRLLRDPSADPSAVWTEITRRYLRIVPHPELLWWALRVQLVDNPGNMVNYGLGAVLTAEIRAATIAAIGSFDAGNVRWYRWTRERLLRFGSERDTRSLMTELLGRPASREAVLQQLRRCRGGRVIAERRSVLHSWCRQLEWNAPTVVGGNGAHLYLEDGRTILDMSSLSECSNLGHQHPRVVAAIREQAASLCFVTSAWGARPRAELAARLLELTGFEGGRVFFTLGGADANEHAVKIVRQALGRPRGIVIARDRSYHGATHLAMALSGDTRTRAMVDPDAMGVSHVEPPYTYRCPFGSVDDATCGERAAAAVATRIDDLGAAQIAAVILEPNAGSNGIVAPDNYWPAVRRHTAARGIPLIADEVMSAFGRCGEWFAWQRFGAAGLPDVITLAKGLTGAALPLGAVVISAELVSRLETQVLNTGLTYCGHPLACAAGVAAIAAYTEERLIERSRSLGAVMKRELDSLATRHPVIGDVRGGHGLFAVLELVADRATREPLAPWPQMPPALDALLGAALAEGVSFGARGNLLLLAPPLVIGEQELAAALALLDRLLTHFFPSL